VRKDAAAGRRVRRAIYLYGQGGVPRPEDQREILTRVRRALRHGAPLVLELRDAASVDRGSDTRWWAGTTLSVRERIWS